MDVAIDEGGLLERAKIIYVSGKANVVSRKLCCFFVFSWTGALGGEEVGERVLEGGAEDSWGSKVVYTVRQGREERTNLGARRACVSPSLPAVPRDFRSLGTLFLDEGGRGVCGL